MVKKLIVIILLLLVIQTVIADTTFKIITLGDHRISLIIRENGKLTTIDSHHLNTGNGDLTITSSVTPEYLDLIVTLKKNTEEIIERKFEEVKSGEEILIKFIPGDVELKLASEVEEESEAINESVVNETANVTIEENSNVTLENNTEINETVQVAEEIEENETQETEQEDTKTEEINVSKKDTTGFSVLGNLEKSSDYLLKIIGIIIVIFIMIFLLSFLIKKFKKGDFNISSNIKTKSMSEFLKSKDSSSKRIDELERKIIETKKELDDIRDRERKLKELKDEIRKLERGY